MWRDNMTPKSAGKKSKKFGKILVQESGEFGCGVVEMITHGCVICYWEFRNVDGNPFPELREVHDRLTSVEIDREEFWKALEWGRKLSEVLL